MKTSSIPTLQMQGHARATSSTMTIQHINLLFRRIAPFSLFPFSLTLSWSIYSFAWYNTPSFIIFPYVIVGKFPSINHVIVPWILPPAWAAVSPSQVGRYSVCLCYDDTTGGACMLHLPQLTILYARLTSAWTAQFVNFDGARLRPSDIS